nr:MAG TPA_asm: tailspike protein [Caudoviricetes sp.]
MIEYVKRLAGPFTSEGQSRLPFGFLIFEKTDVYVATADDPEAQAKMLVYGQDYSVEMNADQTATPGGTVVLTTPIVKGNIFVVGSAVAYTQNMQLTNYSRFPPEIINEAMDRVVVQIQQLVERLDRTLSVPPTSDSTPEQLIEKLLSAQNDARQFADAAQKSAEEAKKSEEQTKEYAEAATALVPMKAEIKTVADNIEPVVATGTAIEDVKTVASIKPEVVEVAGKSYEVTKVAEKIADVVTVSKDMPYVETVATDLIGKVVGNGDYDCGSTTDEIVGDIEVVNGNIHTVATNIDDVNKVADAIDRGDLETAVNAVETTTENVRLSQAAQKSAEAANASAIEAKAGADASNVLASKWATQTTAPVEGELYGAKYYAERAAQSESSTSGLLQEVMDATAAGVRNIQSVGSTQVTAVQNAGSTTIDQITQEGSSQKSVVAAEGTKQVGLVVNAGTTQVAAVNAAGATQTANAKAQADAAAKSATAASSAQKAAETAKGGADTAKSGAESAKTAAVTAQGKAETAATTATQKASDAGTKASEAAKSAQAAAESAKVAAFAVRLTSTNVSASGTAALTSLTPSANVKVGDTVIDPDGEVFQIASIASSTFTVGARLANVRGPQGPKGETGAALAIKGSFPSLEELQEQHPTGTLGDAYMVGSRLYSWSGSAWVDCGDIKGPKGDQGIQGERGPTGPAGTTTWAGITGKPTLGALSARDKITIADFEGDIDLGSTT